MGGEFYWGKRLFGGCLYTGEMAAPAIGGGVPQKQHRQCTPTALGLFCWL